MFIDVRVNNTRVFVPDEGEVTLFLERYGEVRLNRESLVDLLAALGSAAKLLGRDL